MRISVAVGALPFYPTSTAFHIAKRAGAAGVELLPTPRMLRRGPGHYARLAESHDIAIYSVHEPLRWTRYDPKRHLRDAEQTIEFAAALPNCQVVVLHFPLFPEGSTIEIGHWLEAVHAARRRGGNPDLIVTLENSAINHDKLPQQPLDDIHLLRQVVGEWDMYLTFDLAHAASRGLDLVETATSICPRVANIHISDARERHLRGALLNGLFRDHLLPGSGYLPISDIIYSLCQTGYDGLLTLELSPTSLQAWIPFQPQRLLTRAVEAIREDVSVSAVITETTNSPHHRKTR